jgi:hypothetical protein
MKKHIMNLIINFSGLFLICFTLGLLSYTATPMAEKEIGYKNSVVDWVRDNQELFFILSSLLFCGLVYFSLKFNKK